MKAKSCRKFKKTEVGKTTFRIKIEFEKCRKRRLNYKAEKVRKTKKTKVWNMKSAFVLYYKFKENERIWILLNTQSSNKTSRTIDQNWKCKIRKFQIIGSEITFENNWIQS